MRVISLLALGASAILGQSTSTTTTQIPDQYIQMLRSDVRTDKEKITLAALELSDEQSKAFTPVYRDYANELAKIYDVRIAMIKDYVQMAESIDDAQAQIMVQKYFKTEQDAMAIRKKYIGRFSKVLTGKSLARFFQVETQLNRIVDLQLASVVPLMPK